MNANTKIPRATSPTRNERGTPMSCTNCKAPCSLRTKIGCSSAAKPGTATSQDSFRIGGGGTILAISDGINGGPNGALYSKVASNVLVDSYEKGASLEQAFEEAAGAVERLGAWLKEGGGTTLMAAELDGDTATIAWVGDSETSLLREGQLTRLTSHDRHENNGRLSQALGTGRRFETHVVSVPLMPEDVLVLSTDGVWSELSAHEMGDCLADAKSSPATAARSLVTRRRQGRRKDDATAIVVTLGAE